MRDVVYVNFEGQGRSFAFHDFHGSSSEGANFIAKMDVLNYW